MEPQRPFLNIGDDRIQSCNDICFIVYEMMEIRHILFIDTKLVAVVILKRSFACCVSLRWKGSFKLFRGPTNPVLLKELCAGMIDTFSIIKFKRCYLRLIKCGYAQFRASPKSATREMSVTRHIPVRRKVAFVFIG